MIVLACQVGGCPTDPEPDDLFCAEHAVPVSRAPDDMDSLKGRRCRCSRCDLVAIPRASFDFYVLPPHVEGKPLLCEQCLYVIAATSANIDSAGAA